MTVAVLRQTLQSLPPHVAILEGFDAENTLDVNRGEECLGTIGIREGDFVRLEEDENGRLLPSSPGELPPPLSAGKEPSDRSSAENGLVSRIPRDTLLATVQKLPPEAQIQEPIDDWGYLEVYQGQLYIGHISLQDGAFVPYDVATDPEERNHWGEEEE